MKVGIIGTQWGRMHLGSFRGAGAQVVAVCGRSPAKTQALAEAEGVERATTDVDALCEAASDLVVIASPDSQHAEHIRTAWRHRRSVLCEKPLTLTAEEATALALQARSLEAQGLRSHLNFPYRSLPSFRALEQWLSQRRPEHLSVTVRNGFVPREQKGAERVLRTGSADFGGVSHVLDAALWLTQAEPLWVQATLSGRPVHSVSFQVGLSTGATLALNHLATPEPGIYGGWSIIGEGWEVGLSAGYVPARQGWCLSPVRGFEEGHWKDVAPADEPRPDRLEPWAQAHLEVAREVVSAFAEKRPCRLPTFEDGARVQRVFTAALQSDVEGCRVNLA